MPSCQDRISSETAAATSTTTTTSTSQASHTESLMVGESTTPPQDSLPQESYSSPQTEYQNPQGNKYFCGTSHTSITDMCLQSKPCPTGIAAIHCEHQEGCFAHLECQAMYDEAGATSVTMEGSDILSAFAEFDSSELSGRTEGEDSMEESSFWGSTWRNSAQTCSCTLSLLTVGISGVLLLMQ